MREHEYEELRKKEYEKEKIRLKEMDKARFRQSKKDNSRYQSSSHQYAYGPDSSRNGGRRGASFEEESEFFGYDYDDDDFSRFMYEVSRYRLFSPNANCCILFVEIYAQQ